jgi:hypothetical protein
VERIDEQGATQSDLDLRQPDEAFSVLASA